MTSSNTPSSPLNAIADQALGFADAPAQAAAPLLPLPRLPSPLKPPPPPARRSRRSACPRISSPR